MQSMYDINTLIIIITFLLVLVAASYLINKKKDLLRSHLRSNNTLNIISNSIIGNGNRVTIFEIRGNSFLVVTNRSNISNIITLPIEQRENNKIDGAKSD
mgnify:CR=1 FL=1|jgi:flagellar biogenesis protein FliO